MHIVARGLIDASPVVVWSPRMLDAPEHARTGVWDRPGVLFTQEPLPFDTDDELRGAFAYDSRSAAGDQTATQLASTLLRVFAEVARGRRPIAQLKPWLPSDCHDIVNALCRTTAAQRVELASVHAHRVSDDHVEAVGRLLLNGRSIAVAIELRRSADARWQVASFTPLTAPTHLHTAA